MKISLQSIFQKILTFFPWVLMAEIFQYSFQKHLRGQHFFQGKLMFDYFTILDIYVVVAAIFFIFTYGIKILRDPFSREKSTEETFQKFPKELSWTVLLFFIAGFLQLNFQTPYEPILSTPSEYFRSFFIYPLVLFFIFFKGADSKTMARTTRQYTYMIGTFCALALTQYFFKPFTGDQYDFMHRLTWPYLDFLTLKATSANWIAFFVTPGFLLSFIAVAKKIYAHQKPEIFTTIACILSGLTLYLTQSYGAYLAIALTILLFFFQLIKNRKHFAIVLIICAVLGGGIIFAQKNSFKYQVLTGEKQLKYDNSVTSRGDIWRMNYALFREHPILGAGLNAYQSWFQTNDARILDHKFGEVGAPPHAHNFFASFFVNLGIFGLTGILVLIIAIFQKNKPKTWLENPAIYTLLAIMIHGLVDSYFWKQEIAYTFWWVVLMAYKEQL